MHITSLPGVRAALRLSANQLADGYAARYQNPGGKQLYGLAGLDSAQVITVYGVAKRGNAEDLRMLFSVPDYTDNSVKNDLVYIGSQYLANSNGLSGLAFNSYTGGFTATNEPLAQGSFFQYTARLYNAHPELFALRVNGENKVLARNSGAHAARYFSSLFCLGGDNSNSTLDWIGELPDTVVYLGNQAAAVDAQNEAYLMQLYNIAP